MARVNIDFYRSVKLKMTLEDVRKYQPFHKGLDVNFYAPVDDRDRNLLLKPGYNTKKITEIDATFTSKSINPNPLLALDMRDIDDEIAMIDSRFKVLKDHLKPTDNKRLIHRAQPANSLLRHATILDHPYLDGENDRYRSTATEVHDVTIPVETIREEEAKFEKRKAFYNRSKLKYVTKLDRSTNQKVATFKVGYIGNNDNVNSTS